MTTTPAPTTPATCTVVTGTATRCGKPAVATFTGRDGTVYGECAEHCLGTTTPTGHGVLVPGARVRVTHIGVSKVATVVHVRRTKATVEVPVYAGTPRATTKLLTVDIAEIGTL